MLLEHCGRCCHGSGKSMLATDHRRQCPELVGDAGGTRQATRQACQPEARNRSPSLPDRIVITSDCGSCANWYARDLKIRRSTGDRPRAGLWEQLIINGDPKSEASQKIFNVSYSRFAEMIGLRGIYVDEPEMLTAPPGSSRWRAIFP